MEWLPLITAFSIGLLGGAHCIGMCGGIIGALTMAIKPEQYSLRLLLIIAYNLGRIGSYVIIAIIFYWLVSRIETYFALNFMRIIAGLLLIAMGLYLADWWRGLTYLEKLGGILWRRLQPLSKSLLPVNNPGQALLLGMLWGWLPCGLIYSALAYAATANSVIGAALIMLSFALGTLPAVVFTGLLAERLVAIIRQQQLRTLFAVLIIAFGFWTLANTHGHAHHPVSESGQQHHHH